MRNAIIISVITPLLVLVLLSMLFVGDLFVVTHYAIAKLIIKTGHLTILENGQGWYGHYNTFVVNYPISGLMIGILSMVADLDPWYIVWLPINALSIIVLLIANVQRVLSIAGNVCTVIKLLLYLTPLIVLSMPIKYSTLLYHTLALTYVAYIISLVMMITLQPYVHKHTYILILLFTVTATLTHYRATLILLSFLSLMLIFRLLMLKRSSTIEIASIAMIIFIISVIWYSQEQFIQNLVRNNIISIEYLRSLDILIEELIVKRGPKETLVLYMDYYVKNLLSKYPVALVERQLQRLIPYYIAPALIFTLVVMMLKNFLN